VANRKLTELTTITSSELAADDIMHLVDVSEPANVDKNKTIKVSELDERYINSDSGSAAEIKTLYESNADTNEFSDSEEAKLAGIETSATADQSDGEIKTAYENNADTNAFSDSEQTKLSGIATGANVNTVDSVSGKTGVVTLDKTDVGLTDVDNTSDASKPVSTATQTALDDKVDDSQVLTDVPLGALFTDVQLSDAEVKTAYENNADTNEFSDAEKTKLSGIEVGAEINTVNSVNTKTGAVTLDKTDIGLANVDNTSDANKPVSTAGQSALDDKVTKVTSTDNAVARFDGTNGELQDSGVYITDSGQVGIGTASPANDLHVDGSAKMRNVSIESLSITGDITTTGLDCAPTIASTGGTTIQVLRAVGTVDTSIDTTSTIYSLNNNIYISGDQDVSYLMGQLICASLLSGYSGKIINFYGLQILAPSDGSGGSFGGIDRIYGIEVKNQTGNITTMGIKLGINSGTNKWNLYAVGTADNYMKGSLGIGISTPRTELDVIGDTKLSGQLNLVGLSTYADDSAAGTGGLVAGDVYKTSTGELRIKL